MKKFKLFVTGVVVSICVLFGGLSMPITCHAAGTTQVEPRMVYIAGYSTDLSISSTGVASVSGLVRGKAGVTSTYVKVTLQLSVSGNWVDVKTWEDSSNNIDATVADTYQLFTRGTYRTVMVCRANNEEKEAISAYRTF